MRLAAALLLCAGAAHAQEPLTFKGFAPGAERSAVVAAFPKLRCKADACLALPIQDCARDEACAKAYRYAGALPASTTFRFRAERLVSVMVRIPAPHFDALSAAALERFGPPQLDDQKSEIDDRTLLWERGAAVFILRKRSARIGESTALLFDKREPARQEDETRQKAKEDAKDM